LNAGVPVIAMGALVGVATANGGAVRRSLQSAARLPRPTLGQGEAISGEQGEQPTRLEVWQGASPCTANCLYSGG